MAADDLPRRVDVAVVGAGIAGLSAAVRCTQAGLRVAVLEQSRQDLHLCSSRLASGVFHVAMTSPATPPEVLEQRMLARYPAADRALVRTMAQHALRAARWLRDTAQAHFIRAGAEPFYDYVLAPPAVARTGRPWQGRGADVLLRRLEGVLEQRGGAVFRGRRAVGLVMEAGRCTGVRTAGAGGVEALECNAVVLADGGFQADGELLRRYVTPRPEDLVQRNGGTGRGDGLRMALEAGAGVYVSPYFYGHLQSRSALTDDMLWPYPWLDELARASILVGSDGRRFADEGRGGIYLANQVARLPRGLDAFVIADHEAWNGPGAERPTGPNPKLVRCGGLIHRAERLSDLGALAGIDARELARTVAAYNEALLADDVARLVPIRTTREFKAWPILTPPFYAIPVAAGITYTFGGIAVDEHSRVLDRSHEPMTGLYAAGSAAGGLEGGEGVAYFGGLCKAVVTGLRAAEHIVGTS